MRRAVAALPMLVLCCTAWAQTCLVCGEVRSVREVGGVQAAAPQAPVGTASGLDTAPVVGNVAQFRFDRGRSEGWSLGAAGTPEMQARFGETVYEVTVRMDDGERRTVALRDGNRFRVGQRVALRGGELDPM
jgi:outer membrane lipoprotein SlyB